LRLGILADPHLVPDDHATDGDMARYRSALRRCVREGVDGLALLGDLSWSGDAASLEAGLRLAARTGLAVRAVSGNHDLGEREDALAEAVRRVGAKNVWLATPAGEVFGGEGVRVTGLCVASDNYGYTARSDERPVVSGWGEETVVLLSHYPMISFRERAEREGVYYGDNDLENLEEVARPLLGRTAPTVVINGHMHMRDDCAAEQVLQISHSSTSRPEGVESRSEWNAYRSPHHLTTSVSRPYPPLGYDGSSRRGCGVRRRRSRRSRRRSKEQRASPAHARSPRATSSGRSRQIPSSSMPRANRRVAGSTSPYTTRNCGRGLESTRRVCTMR
jgi:predicted phosphodiesterase